jgi:hypothetical protein
LISLGNAQLKVPPSRITKKNLIDACHYFSQALNYLRNNPTTTRKQVARVCQKLLEATLGLSQIARTTEERMKHANQAQKYGEVALENVVNCGDQCMAAQVQFFLACVTAWKVYLNIKEHAAGSDNTPDSERAQLLLFNRMEKLKDYPTLDVGWYERQVRTYVGYLTGA